MLIVHYGIRLFRKVSRKINGLIYRRELEEHLGDMNTGRTIYIITRDTENVGLFSYVSLALGHIAYAKKRGFIPVIDMMNYPNTYLDKDKVGKENSWEYFFEQPASISLTEAYQSNCVIKSYGVPEEWPDTGIDFIVHKSIREKWRKIVRDHIRIKPEILQEVESEVNRIFTCQDRVLGVKCRGTDYLALKPKRHPRQPEPEQVIDKAKQVIKDYNCNMIFLSTEDQDIYDKFKKEFGDIVVSNEQMRYDYDGIHYISEMKGKRQNDAYLQGVEYLVSTLILSKCNCFIGGRNGGTVGALLFTEGYEYEYVWNLGRY